MSMEHDFEFAILIISTVLLVAVGSPVPSGACYGDYKSYPSYVCPTKLTLHCPLEI